MHFVSFFYASTSYQIYCFHRDMNRLILYIIPISNHAKLYDYWCYDNELEKWLDEYLQYIYWSLFNSYKCLTLYIDCGKNQLGRLWSKKYANLPRKGIKWQIDTETNKNIESSNYYNITPNVMILGALITIDSIFYDLWHISCQGRLWLVYVSSRSKWPYFM